MNDELRWKQRFQNLKNAYEVFQRRITEYEKFPDSEAYQMALVQGYEIVLELAWKTMKDYLENEGYTDVNNGKQAIRSAFQDGLIEDAETWMEALEKRNLTSHTYDMEILKETLGFIHCDFYQILTALYSALTAKDST